MSDSSFNEHDVARVERMAREFLRSLEAERLPAGVTDVRVSHFAILALVEYIDEDGDPCEAPTHYFEVSKPHAQFGLISAVYERMRTRYWGGP